MQHQTLQSSKLGKSEKRGYCDDGEEEESVLIKLRVGDCEGSENKGLIGYKKCFLNSNQLFEFRHQALIFKYLRAGVPVPVQLVVPIWKAVVSSFGSDTASFLKQFPSFVGFSPEKFCLENMMEPEPGRCRRTDGKKWRCRKNVVPNQKYCERHMHRGRQRSRKPVEASQNSSLSSKTTTATESSKTISSLKSTELIPSGDSKNSEVASTIFQFMSPSSYTTTSSDRSTTITTTSSIIKNNIKTEVGVLGLSNGNHVDRGVTVVADANIASPVLSLSATTSIISTVTVASHAIATAKPIPHSIHSTGPKITTMLTSSTPAAVAAITSSFNARHYGTKCATTKSFINIGKDGTSNQPAGMRFSPKSVLQVIGCNAVEPEPGRCRRTDGKKWRCSRDVVPDQKYCLRHMHRGVKKRIEGSQPNASTVSSRAAIVSSKTDSATLNTNLSISMPAQHLVKEDEEKSSTNSSDATISDSI